MIETSAEINEIAAACAKVQGELENIGKGGVNPHYRTKYATLPDVLDEVRSKYAAAGVAIWQCPVNGEGANIGVVTRFAHASGQWIQSTLYVAPTKFDAQSAGSAITYLRRYALMAMAGVSAEDDDGTAAVARPEAPARPAGARSAAPAPQAAPMPNGQAEPANGDAEALAAGRRIFAAIGNAEVPKLVDEIIGGNSVDLAVLKRVNEQAYDAIMQKADARKSELLSGA